MTRFVQQELGRCDFLDVLEESVLMKARTRVELIDGTVFEDRIRDVVTREGHEEIRFEGRDAVRLRDVAAIERPEIAHTYRRDPRHDPDWPTWPRRP